MPPDTETEIHALRQRLTKLARPFLAARFGGGNGLWKLQTELLALQRDVQSAIAAAKRNPSRDDAARVELEAFRSIRWHARRFGDAIAWIFLALDRKVIYSLAENQRVSIPEGGHSDRGVMAMASILNQSGWGFPLLHDITDCLRIGDVSFVKPGEQPRTIEVKTQFLEETADEDGRPLVKYGIAMVMAYDGGDLPTIKPPGEEMPVRKPTASGLRPARSASTPRAQRQLRRMSDALARQSTQPSTLTEIDGNFVMTAEPLSEAGNHRDAMRRVVRAARRKGYASEAVEDTFLYVAIYDADGIERDRFLDLITALPNDLASSGIFPKSNGDRNGMVLCVIPEPSRGPQLFLPYYLYSLPQTAILDLLGERMLLLVIVNPAQIANALEEAGFEVAMGYGRNGLDSLVASAPIEDSEGRTYRTELRNLSRHITECVMEFRSVDYIVEAATAMLAASRTAMNDEKVRSVYMSGAAG